MWTGIQLSDVRVEIIFTSVVFHRGLYLNFGYVICFQRIHTSHDIHTVILENLNDCVVRVAARNQQCHKEDINKIFWRSLSIITIFKNFSNQVFVNVYRPMKKCVSPVRKAPTAMRKQPMAMSLGRCSLAPKWLTTARNNKLPTSSKKKKKAEGEREEERKKKHSENCKLHSRTEKVGDSKERPDQVHKWFGLSQQTDGTHLKAAIYESNVRAGEVKTSLYLSDGALHVGSRQSLGETGEGQRHNK